MNRVVRLLEDLEVEHRCAKQRIRHQARERAAMNGSNGVDTWEYYMRADDWRYYDEHSAKADVLNDAITAISELED